MVQAWQAEGVSSRGAVLDVMQGGSRWQPIADALDRAQGN